MPMKLCNPVFCFWDCLLYPVLYRLFCEYIYRNDVYVFRKEGLKGFLYVTVRDIYHVIKVLLTAKEGKLSKIRTIIGGTISGLSFDPKIEYVNDQDGRQI